MFGLHKSRGHDHVIVVYNSDIVHATIVTGT